MNTYDMFFDFYFPLFLFVLLFLSFIFENKK